MYPYCMAKQNFITIAKTRHTLPCNVPFPSY